MAVDRPRDDFTLYLPCLPTLRRRKPSSSSSLPPLDTEDKEGTIRGKETEDVRDDEDEEKEEEDVVVLLLRDFVVVDAGNQVSLLCLLPESVDIKLNS